MGLKAAFLNKGWAGRTMSRKETIERFNPLIRMHYELNHAYDYAINHVPDVEVAGRLDALQRTARADLGKFSETVLSAGGVAYNGVDLDPQDFSLSDEEGPMVHQLRDLEEIFHQRIADELVENHQIRSRAVLSVVQSNSAARRDYLRGVSKKYRRPTR